MNDLVALALIDKLGEDYIEGFNDALQEVLDLLQDQYEEDSWLWNGFIGEIMEDIKELEIE